jgi:hypothetical protein
LGLIPRLVLACSLNYRFNVLFARVFFRHGGRLYMQRGAYFKRWRGFLTVFEWLKPPIEPKAKQLSDIPPEVVSNIWGCIKSWEDDVSREVRLWIQIIQWARFLGCWVFAPALALLAAGDFGLQGRVPIEMYHLLAWPLGVCALLCFGGRYNQYYYLRVEHNAFSNATWFLEFRLLPAVRGKIPVTEEEERKLCQCFNDLQHIYLVQARRFARQIAIESIRSLPRSYPWPEGQARLTPEFDLQAAPNLGRRPKTPG